MILDVCTGSRRPRPSGARIIPHHVVARVAVEKGSTLGWTRYTGLRGHIISVRTFGASAPLRELQRRYGFMPENIVVAARAQAEKACAIGYWERPAKPSL